MLKMNRRDLLKLLPGLGAITMISNNRLFTLPKSKEIHFIGLGNAGSQALEHIFYKGIVGKFTSVNDISSSIPTINFIKFVAPPDNWISNGDKLVRISNMNNEIIISDELKKLFKNNERFILLAGLSGFTGTKLTAALNGYLEKHNKNFISICSLPFDFESNPRKLNAQCVVTNLKSTPNFHFFKLQSIREQYGNMKTNDAFLLGNEFFYKIYLSQAG